MASYSRNSVRVSRAGRMKITFKLLALVALVLAPLATTEASNVLCIFTSNTRSHLIIHMSYARALAERGHNVTVVTTIPIKNKELYNHIYIPIPKEDAAEISAIKTELFNAQSKSASMKVAVKAIMQYGPTQANTMKDQRFQDLMHNPANKFDLLIHGFFMNEFQIGLAEHFNCPIIISWMTGPNLLINSYVGNPQEIAYASPSPMHGTSDPLTFTGRLRNVAVALSMNMFQYFLGRQANQVYSEVFPSPDFPSLEQAKKRISLVFCNSHFSEGEIRPNVPALVEVGGIQIKDKPDPLPEDLQKIVNASKEHGVIYLSFGSSIGSKQLTAEMHKIIFDALSGLKQTVLWKYDEPNTPGNSPNIHYRKWLPQDDLLAQPNLRLFITHAGKGSVAESQYHGVPMVAVPFFADQYGNAQTVEEEGFGLFVDKNTMTAESLRSAVLKVLEDPKYRENVHRFSTLYRDRPLTAKETAIFWMEYVIRHKGAYHMESPLRNLNALQAASIDVIAFLLAVIYVLYKVIRFAGGFVLRKVCRRSCGKPKQKTS